jgi:DnaJ family protein C protein 17
MPSTKNDGIPDSIDPYDILGVSFQASDAEISKAYKKMALQLHPDKQRNKSEAEAEAIAKRFHDVKEARSFLLDAEHAEDRRKFDAKRESDRRRNEADAIRERAMSQRRKQMRSELKRKEEAAKEHEQKKKSKRGAGSRKTGGDDDSELMDELRREGKRRKTEFAERDAAAQQEKDLQAELQRRRDKKDEQEKLEERQVRLKWDRKKVKPSPSEDSLARLFSDKFGAVENVELLGKKGNQALVTFVNSSDCKPCVDYYASSTEMRAKYVGRRKDDEEEMMEMEEETDDKQSATQHIGRSGESLETRRLRQAEERERLLREMEEEESGGGKTKNDKKLSPTLSKASRGGASNSKFPLPLPDSGEYEGLSPLEALEKFEEEVLRNIVSPETLASIKVPVNK